MSTIAQCLILSMQTVGGRGPDGDRMGGKGTDVCEEEAR